MYTCRPRMSCYFRIFLNKVFQVLIFYARIFIYIKKHVCFITFCSVLVDYIVLRSSDNNIFATSNPPKILIILPLFLSLIASNIPFQLVFYIFLKIKLHFTLN